jgi:nucleoside 2-deoxyribosyltransferase
MTGRTSPPLWPDDQALGDVDGSMYQMKSGHRYVISGTLAAVRPNIVNMGRVAMTRYILDHAPGSVPVAFTTDNIDAILSRRSVSMSEKAHRLMREIVNQLDGRPGRWSWGDSTAWSYELLRRACVDQSDEINWLLKYLAKLGWIEVSLHSSGANITLPVEGLIAFEAEAEQTFSRNAFIAMWFNDDMLTAYENAIVPAVSRWGYEPIWIDRQQHNNKIDDEIISEIRRAKFIVADFSCGPDGARGGVYYEAGFASRLGKPVIFTVRASDLDRVHFDTRQFNHIVWETEEQLRMALENRIGATIGECRS